MNPGQAVDHKRTRDDADETSQGLLRLCPPRRRWRSFGVLFDSNEHSPNVQETWARTHLALRRVLLLGPAYFPLREIGASLVSRTKHALELRVHTASGLPLAQSSALLQEDLCYIVFVVDMASQHSFSLFCESIARVLPTTLQRCGVALVYGADDEASQAFPLLDLLQAASQHAVQLLFIPAPHSSGVGLTKAARAGAERLASLFEGDVHEGNTLLLRMRALQGSLGQSPTDVRK